jgi:hypothetical protein
VSVREGAEEACDEEEAWECVDSDEDAVVSGRNELEDVLAGVENR